MAIEADCAVADVDRRVARRAVDRAEQPGDARGRLHEVVIDGLSGIWPALAVADGGAIDDAGIAAAHGLVVEAEALQALRPHVRDQNIGARGECERRLPALGRFQIERDAALVAVGLQEQRAHPFVPPRANPPHGVAARRFDFDDVGAEIAEDLGRERTHHDGRQVEHADSTQGPGGGFRLVRPNGLRTSAHRVPPPWIGRMSPARRRHPSLFDIAKNISAAAYRADEKTRQEPPLPRPLASRQVAVLVVVR
jgi:hypothetical protein